MPMPEPAEAIRERARKVVNGVRDDDVGVYRMVKRMVAHTIKEYRGRFLHELVQNGYDAHPAGTDNGRIAIHFDETEGYGVLYVANGGQPLTVSNFERMASLGESDKTIGVGIGNKGVGFKSVFQICDVPEVYSARDLDDPGFSGFSFRFGTDQDLLEHLDGDVALAEQVAANLSLSMLTVPLAEAPETVQQFRERGYVTVLRLPANDERAATEIRERMARLVLPAAPIMLFLERLRLLSIKSGSTEDERCLTRQVAPGGEGTGSTTVVLDGAHEFRLFTAQVPQELLKAALQDSVEEGALDERWLEWDAEAHVSVAVGKDQAVTDGRAFTYLPMGDGARSLLAGHMNAPFVTNFARVDLDHGQPVNRLMVDRIAELCLDSVAALAQADEDANLVVDLVAWHDRLDDLLRTCRDRRGTDLTRFVTLPTRRGQWRDLKSCHLWRWTDTSHLDEALVTAHTAADLLDPDLIDATRLSAVADLAEALGAPLEPPQDVLADWVESIATAMLSDHVEVATWSRLYDDLKQLFDPEGVALRGRKILLTSANTLAPCDEPAEAAGSGRGRRRRHRSVFFYPRRSQEQDDDEDVTDEALPTVGTGSEANVDVRTPESLGDHVVFMHPQLEWNPGGVNRDGRTFLENAHLVQIFRTEPLLKLLGRVLESSTSNRVKRDALEFAFRLIGGDPRRHARELANVGLQVPTDSGRWIRASHALFGDPWDVPGAAEISALAAGASEETPELATLADLIIAVPEALTSLEGPLDPDRWIAFLSILGVMATLPVRTATDPRSIAGRNLTTARIVGGDVPEVVPSGVREQWRRGLDLGGNHYHPETPFTTSDPICWFTGQHEVHGLPRRLRVDYALLLIRTLPTLQPWHWSSTWRRKRSGGWDSHGGTPLACFVREEPWLPVSRSGTEQSFGAPRDTWQVTAEDQMAANYSPLLEPRARRTLAGIPGGARSSLERHGLRTWGSPAHARLP